MKKEKDSGFPITNVGNDGFGVLLAISYQQLETTLQETGQ